MISIVIHEEIDGEHYFEEYKPQPPSTPSSGVCMTSYDVDEEMEFYIERSHGMLRGKNE